ncbi:MAG: DUF1588 domain-containing protein [Myxococcales bacterium]|nr:DUF1588 domain-containing protein [Myxococcales bacterium]
MSSRNRWRMWTLGALALAAFSTAACSSDEGTLGPGDNNDPNNPDDPEKEKDPTKDPTAEETILDHRVINYGEAYKTLHLKLLDITPNLTNIKRLDSADDQQAEYEAMVDEIFEDQRLAPRMIRWWRDTLRQGGGDLDTAPTFAARVMMEGKPYTELFTASSNTCPTYTDGQFVDGDCNNNVPTHAGVLTNPGSMAQFYGNMAFRRARWIQETFACKKYPAEYSDTPEQVGEGQYTSPWPFGRVAEEPINFQDTSSVVCANCHSTMNGIAPLVAQFDENGMWQDSIQVQTPIAPEPVTTELSHWLKPGEPTAWRQGVEVTSLPELGQAMADDPSVRACITARLWNFTMSKEDIVAGLATVPTEVIDDYMTQLGETGDMKATLKAMFKSEDFVSF